MTGPRCLCPPPFVREPGRHLVGCPHAPGDTVAPARALLERPPVDQPPPAPLTAETVRAGFEQLLDAMTLEHETRTVSPAAAALAETAIGRELVEQATGLDPLDPPSLAPRPRRGRAGQLVDAWRRGWRAGTRAAR